jgi:gluconolactonase
VKITKRSFVTGLAVAGTAATVAGPASSAWEESQSYPDPRVQILDPSFARYRVNNAGIERLFTGTRWSEGPVWFGDARCLLWSDIPNDRILRWDELTGCTRIYRQPSNNANGLTRDRQGRLVTCEQNTRRITRTEYDGTITILIDKFDGKPLNSPNDVVVKSDDSIWFSDPAAAGFDPYEGRVEKPEMPSRIYRFDPKSGRASVIADDLRPNGLCFSPDERKIYLADNSPMPRVIRAYALLDEGTKLGNRRTVVTCDGSNIADGFRCDSDGNLWVGWGPGEELNGVMIFNAEGKRIGKISLPERCANLCFGGLRRNRLFMAASHSLYSLYVNVQGARGG